MQAQQSDELLAAAAGLVASAGLSPPVSLVQLEGGKNNRVFRIDLERGGPLVLKSYFTDVRDPRDRLAAEWGFLTYAWRRGVRAIPEPIAADAARRVALYSFVPGRKLTSSEVGADEVEAAADFVLAVNRSPHEPTALGSEACFSIKLHLATIERRVGRLASLDRAAPHRRDAERLVATRLVPMWTRLKQSIADDVRAAGIDFAATLSDESCCMSPSDFGFHNALSNAGHLTFLDFEYAGRDDPAKLVCDFFCQPEIPVPSVHFERFLNRIATGLGLSANDRLRCHLLLDAYRIKWTCIILNDFLPLGAARRAFADHSQWATRCAAQLAKADVKLCEITLV